MAESHIDLRCRRFGCSGVTARWLSPLAGRMHLPGSPKEKNCFGFRGLGKGSGGWVYALVVESLGGLEA